MANETDLIKSKHSGLSRNRKNSELRFAIWNVRTMLKVGAMLEIMKVAEKYKLNVVVLHEIRWRGVGRIDKKRYTIIYSGGSEQEQNGIAFMVPSQMR